MSKYKGGEGRPKFRNAFWMSMSSNMQSGCVHKLFLSLIFLFRFLYCTTVPLAFRIDITSFVNFNQQCLEQRRHVKWYCRGNVQIDKIT
jgi:hypothetical protein